MEINRNFFRPEGAEVKASSTPLDRIYRAYNADSIIEAPIVQVQLYGGAAAWKIDLEGIPGYVPRTEIHMRSVTGRKPLND